MKLFRRKHTDRSYFRKIARVTGIAADEQTLYAHRRDLLSEAEQNLFQKVTDFKNSGSESSTGTVERNRLDQIYERAHRLSTETPALSAGEKKKYLPLGSSLAFSFVVLLAVGFLVFQTDSTINYRIAESGPLNDGALISTYGESLIDIYHSSEKIGIISLQGGTTLSLENSRSINVEKGLIRVSLTAIPRDTIQIQAGGLTILSGQAVRSAGLPIILQVRPALQSNPVLVYSIKHKKESAEITVEKGSITLLLDSDGKSLELGEDHSALYSRRTGLVLEQSRPPETENKTPVSDIQPPLKKSIRAVSDENSMIEDIRSEAHQEVISGNREMMRQQMIEEHREIIREQQNAREEIREEQPAIDPIHDNPGQTDPTIDPKDRLRDHIERQHGRN